MSSSPFGLTLRPFTDADTEPLTAALSDPELAMWNSGAKDGDVVAWWTRLNDRSDQSHVSWAVADLNDRLVGSVSLYDIELRHVHASVGYRVLPHARRQGVATWALRAACDYAFSSLGLVRVQLFHSVANEPSCRVAMAGGFSLEGTSRQSYRYGDGLLHDEHLHGLLVTDPR